MNIIGTQESSEFWQKRVGDLTAEAAELERRLGHASQTLHEVLASGNGGQQGEAAWREKIAQLSVAKDDAVGALHQAKKFLRRSLGSDQIKEAFDRGEKLRKAVSDREKSITAAQRHLTNAFKKISETYDFTKIIRENGDSQLRAELNDASGAVVKYISAKIINTMPHAAAGAAVALSHPAVTLDQVGDKSLADLVGNPVTDFEKRNPDARIKF